MNIHEWNCDHCYVGLLDVPRVDSGARDLNDLLLETRPLRSEWVPLEVRFGRHDSVGNRVSRRTHPHLFIGDYLNDCYLSWRAVAALRDLLEAYGEVLPVTSKDGEFYVYHCTNQLDAIEPIKCEFDGMNIRRYEFRPHVVEGQHIFRPSFPYRNPVFVSDAVVERVRAADLKGFKFVPVWGHARDEAERAVAAKPVEARPLSDRPLDADERRDVVDQVLVMAKRDLKIDVVAAAPDRALAAVARAVADARKPLRQADDAFGLGMFFGSLLGELVVRHLGWQWAMVRGPDGDESAKLVTTDRAHVFDSHTAMYDLLAGAADPRVALADLYARLRPDRLPPAVPGAYAPVP